MVITAPEDVLVPNGAQPLKGTVLTKALHLFT